MVGVSMQLQGQRRARGALVLQAPHNSGSREPGPKQWSSPGNPTGYIAEGTGSRSLGKKWRSGRETVSPRALEGCS